MGRDLRKAAYLDSDESPKQFTPSSKIKAEADRIFGTLIRKNELRGLNPADFTDSAAELFVEINNLHPFREGNGRAQRFFLSALAENAGHELAFDVVTKERMIEVSVAGIDGDVAGAKRLFQEISDPRRVEALRKALGVKQWNLWADSYGSRLALTIARYYPASVRAIVHDGADLPEDQEMVDDFVGTEVALDRLFSKCAGDAACASRFPELRSRFVAALSRLRQQPLSTGDGLLDDGAVMGFVRGWFFGGSYLTFEYRVQNLLTYMDAAARGDGELMVRIDHKMTQQNDINKGPPAKTLFPVEGKYHIGQNLSIDCNEEKSFESMDEYRQAAAKSEIVRSLFGADGGLGNFKTCALWPSGAADPIENTHVSWDGPQLVFTGELDASLSGMAGYKIAMLYAKATNVVFENGEHIEVTMEDADTSNDWNYYRLCAAGLARQFLSDPQSTLDTRCARTRKLRLVP